MSREPRDAHEVRDGPADLALIAEFRRRRKRQWIASGIAVVAIIGAILGDEALGGESRDLRDRPLTIVGFAIVLAVLIFSLKNWRCPKCSSYLGKRMAPRFCSACGAQLAE